MTLPTRSLLPRALAATTLAVALARAHAEPTPAPATPTPPPATEPLNPYAHETRAQKDARMAWFREARFGMFIHWGVYAVPQGEFEGKRNDGLGEWLLWIEKVPVERYKQYAAEFTAAQYDPEAWADLAQEAGMRYMVITSKHHDGFALFDSAVSTWDAVDSSPAKRDLIAPLADAARRRGLKFGLYYSQSQDWIHAGGGKMSMAEGTGWDEAHKGSFDDYLRRIAVPQVNEILARFRPDILWWDTPVWMDRDTDTDRARADLLIPSIRLSPGIITNDRLGRGYGGDTATPEQNIPATGYKDRDWEVCMTINDTWGFKSYDHNWKSSAELIRMLCDISGKGGNFLLNVGPTADGLIPPEITERLRAIGAWMKVNNEAIYGTVAGPFQRQPWGRATRRDHADGTTLYLHVFDWPTDGRLRVLGLRSLPASARLLANGTTLTATRDGDDLLIKLPASATDAVSSVIKLEIAGQLDVESVTLKPAADGTLTLLPPMAEIGSHEHGTPVIHGDRIENWTNAKASVQWTFRVPAAGTYEVIADASGEATTRLRLEIDRTATPAGETDIPLSGALDRYQPTPLGRVTVPAGTHTLTLQPAKDKKLWKTMNLRSVRLVPAQ